MFGILNLYKPLHCTSHDVVAKVRKKLGIKKVGHAGTLDPLAEGILPVCVGNATRLIEYLPDDKRYVGKVTFGKVTLTWDAEGDVIETLPAEVLTRGEVETVLQQFQGKIQQQVPPHSAVHVKGKKLYEYARKGIAVELPVREAEIFDIRLLDFQDEGTAFPVAVIEIHCASGTYVRSIAQELGKVTGYGAFLSGLVRTTHGKFTVEDSVSLEIFLDSSSPQQYLRNPVEFLTFPSFQLSLEDLDKIRHGMKIIPEDFPERIYNNRLYVLLDKTLPVAVASGDEGGKLKPIKVFSP